MKRLRLIGMLTILMLALLPLTTRAYACSCRDENSPEVASRQADAIFAGEVVGANVNWTGIFSGEWMDKSILFEVVSTYKGVSQSQVVVTVFESCCRWSPVVFNVGEAYLIYAKATSGDKWETSYWDGTRPIAEANDYLSTLGPGNLPSQSVDLSDQFFLTQYGRVGLLVGLLVLVYFLLRKYRSWMDY